jgi:lipopolysaccharide export system protein LptA
MACIALLFPLAADTLTFSADSVQSSQAKGKERTILMGKASVNADGNLISADRIELYGKNNRYVLCSGNVSLVNTKKGLFVKTQKLDYDRTRELSRMEGFTTLEDKENKVVLKGSFIEHDGKAETAIIQIGVRILKDEMVCRSEYAFYNRKTKQLELSGMPVVNKGQNHYEADTISINLDNDEITMKGSISGKMDTSGSPTPSPGDNPDASADGASPATSASPAPSEGIPAPDLSPSHSPTPQPKASAKP